MTDLQDRILDRLVGTTIGVNWPDGPLTSAAEVVGGKNPIRFGQTDNDRGAKSEIARRLGYSILLCEAIQGGARGLKDEDDRRKFAMTVFRSIPIGGAIPRMSAEAQNRVALQMAIRAHPYLCPQADCPVLQALASLNDTPAITGGMAVAAYQTRCERAGGTLREMASSWLTANASLEHRLVQSAAMVLRGFQLRKSVHGWCSIRESVRLAASQRGIEEAVSCCIAIARQCRMEF